MWHPLLWMLGHHHRSHLHTYQCHAIHAGNVIETPSWMLTPRLLSVEFVICCMYASESRAWWQCVHGRFLTVTHDMHVCLLTLSFERVHWNRRRIFDKFHSTYHTQMHTERPANLYRMRFLVAPMKLTRIRCYIAPWLLSMGNGRMGYKQRKNRMLSKHSQKPRSENVW